MRGVPGIDDCLLAEISFQRRNYSQITTPKYLRFVTVLPYPKDRHRLPAVLSRKEGSHLINAAGNLFRRTLLMTLYGTGVRRSELAHLKVTDIDSQRMIIRVVAGKGNRWVWRMNQPTSPVGAPYAHESRRSQDTLHFSKCSDRFPKVLEQSCNKGVKNAAACFAALRWSIRRRVGSE